MSELLSVGLDVGTTTTSLIVSRLTVENRASSYAVPNMEITGRQILYKSPVTFTPLIRDELVDGKALAALVEQEYKNAGITRKDIDTGAVIITGETSRKENAETVLRELSGFAGDFVVATAGPDLESVLAAKGSGAVAHAAETGKTILHMDIGGGTCNMALIEKGEIVATGCLNVGGRLVKHNGGKITYVSPAIAGLTSLQPGAYEQPGQLENLAQILCSCMEMAAGLRPKTDLLRKLTTKGTEKPWIPPEKPVLLSFSGGVAACMEQDGDFGDLGSILAKAIKESLLCKAPYRIAKEAVRATVIGAGSYATQLSGSTVYCSNVTLPLKNLRVGDELTVVDAPMDYESLKKLAQKLITEAGDQPVYAAMTRDCAKALGHCIALQAPEKPCLCIDGVQLAQGDYLDVGRFVDSCLPVVIKTIIFEH